MQPLLLFHVVIASASCWTAQALAGSKTFPEKEYGNALERKLVEASFDGDIRLVKECLMMGARVDARYGGDSQYFKSQDGGFPLAGHNWTAIMAATEADRFEVVELLIAKGANVRMDDGWGATPLYVLADKRESRKEYDKVAALLISKGADVNAKTAIYIDGPGDQTVLHRAVGWGHIDMIKMLLAARAKVNCQDTWGSTPLDSIVEGRNDREIKRLLIAAGAKQGKITKPKLLQSIE